MKTSVVCIFVVSLYFAAAQKHNSYENAKYDETNSRYLRAIPKILRDNEELGKAAPTEVDKEIVYDKALLKKVVKKLRDYINQVIEKYNLDVITTKEKGTKSHIESHSNNEKDHPHSSTTKADDVLEKSEDEPEHHHKNANEDLPTDLDKEDKQDEDMSERCANYEKHHQKDKTHSNVDSTKAKDDEAEFDDSFSERFLRNIPFDRPNEEDNLH